MRENSHWYCMLCAKTFLPFSDFNDNEFKQTVIRKQVKLTHIAKPAKLQSLISKSKNDFQIIGISETRLKKTQEIFNQKIITSNVYQLNQLMGECCCISKKQSTIN